MIGFALGLMLLAGGTALLASQLQEQRRLLAELRLAQELRGALRAIERELRRAGLHGDAAANLVLAAGDARPPRTNAYQALVPEQGETEVLRLHYSRDDVENHQVDANEAFGLRRNGAGIDRMLGGSWQAVTDPNHLRVERLRLAPSVELAAVGSCERPCPPDDGATPCPPRLQRRVVDVGLQVRSPLDPRVERRLETRVLLPNDALDGRCPS